MSKNNRPKTKLKKDVVSRKKIASYSMGFFHECFKKVITSVKFK